MSSRCKSCDRIMKRCDLEVSLEEAEKKKLQVSEEELCKSCRQEIFKMSDDSLELATGLGFSLEETLEMEDGIFTDYRGGGFQE